MRNKLNRLMEAMIAFDRGDPTRIQHFIKVASLAREIASLEGCDEYTINLVEATGYVHDIGIIVAEKELGYSTHQLQEEKGPAPAREMMQKIGFDENFIERVCFIVGHHHTFKAIDGLDFQIVFEADYLVNAFEDHHERTKIINARNHIFKTKAGTQIINDMFGL